MWPKKSLPEQRPSGPRLSGSGLFVDGQVLKPAPAPDLVLIEIRDSLRLGRPRGRTRQDAVPAAARWTW